MDRATSQCQRRLDSESLHLEIEYRFDLMGPLMNLEVIAPAFEVREYPPSQVHRSWTLNWAYRTMWYHAWHTCVGFFRSWTCTTLSKQDRETRLLNRNSDWDRGMDEALDKILYFGNTAELKDQERKITTRGMFVNRNLNAKSESQNNGST